MKSREFEDKVVIVTGGASGIGLATAKTFAGRGARVIIADHNEKSAAEAVGALREECPGAEIRMSACDVSVEAQVEAAVRSAMDSYGQLDVVVNNAGLMIFKSIEDHTVEDWNRVLAVDLVGAFLFVRHAFRVMKKGSAIVNVSSIHAVETTPHVSAYAAAKAALLSLTRSAAIEGKPKGIRVNAVLPGAIDTPMLWENPNIKSGLEVIHQADVGRPVDVANTIAFLASSDAQFVQGAALNADGGRLGRL